MHTSAYKNAERFYEKYCTNLNSDSSILDFGSYDVNGTLKPIFQNHKYIGIDMHEGPNVNLVCRNDNVPFKDNFFDIIVSSSCFEHDEFFWITFLEMSRVIKPNGFIYINAPSTGHYHPHPIDNWRFYADSWKCLEKWAFKNNFNIKLIESYIDSDCEYEDSLIWKDSVGIFKKL